MKKADVIVSIILFFLGIGFAYASMSLSPTRVRHVGSLGPGFLPLWIGVLFALLSLALFISSIRDRGMDKVIWPERQMALKLLSIVMALFLYIVLMDFLGYTISTVLFCIFMIRILHRSRWINALIIADIISIILTIVFQEWFQVSLPRNVFGFFIKISTLLIILAVISILLFLYGQLSKAKANQLHKEGH